MVMKLRIVSTPAERSSWHRNEQPPAAEERKPRERFYQLSDAPIERLDWPEVRSIEGGADANNAAPGRTMLAPASGHGSLAGVQDSVSKTEPPTPRISGPRCSFPRYREIPHFDHRCAFCEAIYPRELAINVYGCESCIELRGMR